MKYLYTTIILCFLTTAIQAQHAKGNTASKTTNFEYSVKKQAKSFSIPVEKNGTYSIVIRDPGGKTISKPINKKSYYKGSTVDFEVNTKFWDSGKYMIILEDENNNPMDVRYIRIAPRNPKG